jgi:DNA-directed RNA polymerase II subunit RPB3
MQASVDVRHDGDEKDAEMAVTFRGIDLALVNAVRRVLHSEVPTVAIEHVIQEQNTSQHNDEKLSHRLGLVPLVSHPMTLVRPELCACDQYCTRCAVCYELRVSNTSRNAQLIVTSAHLRLSTAPEWTGQSTHIVPVDGASDPVHLCTLNPGESVALQAIAQVGTALEHAKWSASETVGLVGYAHIDIDRALESAVPETTRRAIAAACPKKVFGISGAGLLDIENLGACNLCGDCLTESRERGAPRGYLRVQEASDKYGLVVRSTGALSPALAVERAFDVLASKFQGGRAALLGPPAPSGAFV